MDIDVIISVLLTIIGFLLAGLYFDVKKIGKDVASLLINEAANKERLQDLERRIEIVEQIKQNTHATR